MLLDINHLKVSFGEADRKVDAVDDISLNIQPGETFCLVGESGSGKSMTSLSVMKLVSGASDVSGKITFAYRDKNKADIEPRKIDLNALSDVAISQVRGCRIGMIFQEPMTSLNPVLTIGTQISESLIRHENTSKAEAKKRSIAALREVQIPDPEGCFNRYPHELSGGMRQRVMIAIAMILKPDLLIADEPTTALDVTTQAHILELMKDLQQQHGMAILLVTHDFGVVNLMADRVAVMKNGKIVETGDKQTVLYAPSHEYTKRLIASLPSKLTKPEIQTTSNSGTSESLESSESSNTLMAIKNLKIHFPIRKGILKRTVGHVKAVDGVNLNIPRGSITALIGESGSGKTTLGRSLVGLVQPTAGTIIYDNKDMASLNEMAMRVYRNKIQFIFQDPYASLNPKMLIGDILLEGMRALNVGNGREDRMRRIKDILSEVQMPENSLYRYPHEFSGGQRQRIGIARCLAVEPSFIVCDEITSALDVTIQAAILELLLNLKAKRNLTLLFITHNMEVVEYLADEVAVMYKGEIVEQGTKQEVCGNPQHEYTQKLLAAVPRF